MELTTEELSIIYRAVKGMHISGPPEEIAKFYSDTIKPLEVKLADELEKRTKANGNHAAPRPAPLESPVGKKRR